MPTPSSVAALIRSTPTIVRVPHRSLISVSGSQSAAFLNGLLSSFVPNPPRGPFLSAFLHAQGRVLYDVFVYTRDAGGHPAYFLEYDSRVASSSSDVPGLLGYLKRHVLRSNVRVRDATEEHDVWAAWGNEPIASWDGLRRWNVAQSGAIEPQWDKQNQWPWGTEDEVIRDRRAVGMGLRRLVKKGDRRECAHIALPPVNCTRRPLMRVAQEAANHDEASEEDYTLHRIMHGVPEGSLDIPPMQAFPMDSNLDMMGGLDFRKGCYVGQELTVRTYHTGVIRKRILPVMLSRFSPNASSNPSPTPVPTSFTPGTDIRASLTHPPGEGRSARPRGTGKLLSTAKGVGLALLRLEHVEGMLKGNLKLEVIGEEKGLAKVDSWRVTPWWPDCWPVAPSTEEGPVPSKGQGG